jgi:hypothetical protein
MDDFYKGGKLGKNEFRLADFLPDQGPGANWAQNEGALNTIISKGKPMKDLSVDAKTGKFLKNSGFLKMERDYLSQFYRYNSSSHIWFPK